MEFERKHRVVLLAYEGTENDLLSAWQGAMPTEDFKVVAVGEDYDLKKILEVVITDEVVSDDFVLVPANCYPCCALRLADISIPVVRVSKTGEKTYWNRLPVLFNIPLLMDYLPSKDSLPDEDFIREWITYRTVRPVEVSMNWGNYLCSVLRGDPCEHVVIEALIRKKFIVTNRSGWDALARIIHTLEKK